MKRCIINVATGVAAGPGWYPQGQERLAASLREHDYRGDLLLWRDDLPEGCPTHEEAPYAFKYWALEEARQAGYDVAVWCDASVYFVGWPDALFGATLGRGVWVTNAGCSVGTWTSDAALEKLSMSRAEAFDTPMVMATCFGLNFQHIDGRKVLEQMLGFARDGVFKGCWHNVHGGVSPDPKVHGHRHDQSALSVLVKRMHLPRDGRRRLFCYEGGWSREHSVAIAAGM